MYCSMHVYGAAPGDISPCEILTEGLTPGKGNVTVTKRVIPNKLNQSPSEMQGL